MPALRERAEDIPAIVDFCLQNLVKQRKARAGRAAPEAMAVLVRHTWPGNVRELENVIYRSAVIAQGDTILLKDLPVEIREAVLAPAAQAASIPAARPEAAPSAAISEAPAAEAAPAAPSVPTVESALDYIFEKLMRDDEPLMPRLEREMAVRSAAMDPAIAAKKLGLTKAALKKRLGN
jgi:two-component system nitrogen regulation response regulator GlnG